MARQLERIGVGMPKIAKELSALEVKRLVHPGHGGHAKFPVGGVAGLQLQITHGGGRSWQLRTMVGGKRRNIGLGSYPALSLSQARQSATQMIQSIRDGIDPIEQRKAAQAKLEASQRRGMTFAEATERCLAARLDAFRNFKHRQQWENTLRSYAEPELGGMLVNDITVQDVLRVLEPIWTTKTETASRVRGRVEAVISWATVAGHRTGDNPARWAGNLKELLPAAAKVARKSNQPALRIDDAPRWFAKLRQRTGNGARALEFVALTAARSGEVRGATWEEIDLKASLWIIPQLRMKMGREHRVPLTPEAVTLLESLPREAGNSQVFPASRGGELSDMTLSATMKRLHTADCDAGGAGFVDRVSKRPAVPHGLRSTFRDWVSEHTGFAGEMAEVALAHKVSNSVEAAYRRGDLLEKRRIMMAAWANFLTGKPEEEVVYLQERQS